MPRERRASLALVLAGSAAATTWLAPVPWANARFLVLFGALDRLAGPFGLRFDRADDLPRVAGVLGILAAVVGLVALVRGVPAWAAAGAAALLALGAAYIGAWLVDPPDLGAVVAAGQAAFGFGWGTYAGAAALALGAVAAALLAFLRTRRM